MVVAARTMLAETAQAAETILIRDHLLAGRRPVEASLLTTRRRPRLHSAAICARTLTHALRNGRPRISASREHSIRTLYTIHVENFLIESLVVELWNHWLFLSVIGMASLGFITQVAAMRRVQAILDDVPLVTCRFELSFGANRCRRVVRDLLSQLGRFELVTARAHVQALPRITTISIFTISLLAFCGGLIADLLIAEPLLLQWTSVRVGL